MLVCGWFPFILNLGLAWLNFTVVFSARLSSFCVCSIFLTLLLLLVCAHHVLSKCTCRSQDNFLVIVGVCTLTCLPQCMCRSLRTTLWSQFSHSTFLGNTASSKHWGNQDCQSCRHIFFKGREWMTVCQSESGRTTGWPFASLSGASLYLNPNILSFVSQQLDAIPRKGAWGALRPSPTESVICFSLTLPLGPSLSSAYQPTELVWGCGGFETWFLWISSTALYTRLALRMDS